MPNISQPGAGLESEPLNVAGTQEPTVAEPQPSPGPVPSEESPPAHQKGMDQWPAKGMFDPPGTHPVRDDIDPHPLTVDDVIRPEKPAGRVAPSRTYGGGFAKAQRELQPGEPPAIANVPLGQIPTENEEGSPAGPEEPLPPGENGGDDEGLITNDPYAVPPTPAVPPTGTSENPSESNP